MELELWRLWHCECSSLPCFRFLQLTYHINDIWYMVHHVSESRCQSLPLPLHFWSSCSNSGNTPIPWQRAGFSFYLTWGLQLKSDLTWSLTCGFWFDDGWQILWTLDYGLLRTMESMHYVLWTLWWLGYDMICMDRMDMYGLMSHTQAQEIGEAESTHVGINLILHVRLDVYAEFDHAM